MSSRRVNLILFTTVTVGAIGAVVVYTAPEDATILESGQLSKFHAHLAGEAHCQDCHVSGAGLDNAKCLDCHAPLAARIDAGEGYHAQVEGECRSCHSEHLGLDYELVRWPVPEDPFKAPRTPADITLFPHEVGAQFALSGAHEVVECEECHKTPLVRDAAVVSFKEDHRHYLGLGDTCAECHHDAHAPTLGDDCARCHAEEAWDDTHGFDHGDTRFALEGKHTDTDCEGCHREQARQAAPVPTPPIPSFQPVMASAVPRPFRGVGFGTPEGQPVRGDTLPGCTACHENVHRDTAAFQRCEDCHTPHDFGPVAVGAPFDHSRTGWPLDGAHARVSCVDCHGADLNGPVRQECAECHDDAHEGAFDREMALNSGTCESCHDARAWEPSTYAVRSHPLPLVGAHDVACEVCHGTERPPQRGQFTAAAPFPRLPARGRASIGPLEERCASCHTDVHEARLGPDCASCHGYEAWHLAELDERGHAELGFEIRGAHREIFERCEECHGGRRADGGLRQIALEEVESEGCMSCHEDHHKGQLNPSCTSCHTEDAWVPSSFGEVAHAETRFPLNGAHAAVPCQVCHETDPTLQTERYRWAGVPTCASCHDDVHRGQFEGQACTTCHVNGHWEPSTFDAAAHAATTRFPLESNHDRECAVCHIPDPRGTVVFRGTPVQCAGCHEDIHLGQFAGRAGDGCSPCHQVAGWLPTSFDHDQARFKLSGAHENLECAVCHKTVTRQVAGLERQVIHYRPFERFACADCHVNPHAGD